MYLVAKAPASALLKSAPTAIAELRPAPALHVVAAFSPLHHVATLGAPLPVL